MSLSTVTGCMFTLKIAFGVFLLSKVGLNECSHFQKLDWMYVHPCKNVIGCRVTFKCGRFGNGCM